jgi:hypothetical protein
MAGTIVAQAKKIKRAGSALPCDMIEVHLLCSCEAAAATFTSRVLQSLAGMAGFDIMGFYLYHVKVWPGATAPTDASDLTLTDQDGVDLLGARGTDLIDETSLTSCCAGSTNTEMPMPITGPITINISNNAVNAAIINIKLLFVP